jgi:hypothetical protein
MAWIREAAADALGDMGPPMKPFTDALRRLASREANETVKRHLEDAIENIEKS